MSALNFIFVQRDQEMEDLARKEAEKDWYKTRLEFAALVKNLEIGRSRFVEYISFRMNIMQQRYLKMTLRSY